MRQFAPAVARNRDPILEVLRDVLAGHRRVLEIGSGTGEHAAWFAPRLPHLQWQPSDLPHRLDSIEAWRGLAGCDNLLPPLGLDLLDTRPVSLQADAVVCINTVHIVSWVGVEALLQLAGETLPEGGVLYLYGPFRYAGRALEPSNQRFDESLRQRDPDSGIRVFEDVDALARRQGLVHAGDRAMPANNRSLWWRRQRA